MSESDSFIDEVSEEVRKDRLYSTFRKYAWIPGLLVVAIVGGAAANEYFKAQARSEAEATGDAFLAALEAGDASARAAAVAQIEPTRPGQAALAKMTEAAIHAASDDEDAAYAAFRAAADLPDVEAAYSELAALKAAMIRPDEDWSQATFEALSAPGKPYRLLALEQMGLAKVAAGDIDAGLADFNAVLEDPGVTSAMVQRLAQMITALGGELPSFAQTVGGNG